VLGLRLVPQAATLVLEPYANKSFFTGRPIVTDADKDLEPGLQANPSTTRTARMVGEAVNYSPAVIDNHVRNLFGTLGVHLATVSDLILEKAGVVPESRERTWRQWPVIKAFVHDPDNPNSKPMTQFYDDLKKYRQALKSMKELERRGDFEGASEYEARKQPEIDSARRAEKVAARLAKMRRSAEQVDLDRDMTPAEKRERINMLTQEARVEVDAFLSMNPGVR